VSVTDDSAGDKGSYDVSGVIVNVLSDGAKTPLELKDAVLGVVGVSERVYYRHLRKLRLRGVVEEAADVSSKGEVIRRYVLKKPELPNNFDLVSEQGISEHLLNFSKADWEMYTWREYNPDGWYFVDEHDELVVVLISHCVFPDDVAVLPDIVSCDLDPDRYFFNWPQIYKQLFRIGDPLPRFFNLKSVYQAKCVEAVNDLKLNGVSFFIGIKEFVDFYGVRRQVAVIVGRRSDGTLQVCRVEFFPRFSKKVGC
jgi:hypothetical protein